MSAPQETVFLLNRIDEHTHSIRRCCTFINAGEGQTADELNSVSIYRAGAEQLGSHGVGIDHRQRLLELLVGLLEQRGEVVRQKLCALESGRIE